jgi:hypothetical protein
MVSDESGKKFCREPKKMKYFSEKICRTALESRRPVSLR